MLALFNSDAANYYRATLCIQTTHNSGQSHAICPTLDVHSPVSMQATFSTPSSDIQELGTVHTTARPEGLAQCQTLTREVCERLSLDAEDGYAVRLAVEEACTNLVNHGYKHQPPGPLSLRFVLIGGCHLQAHIRDQAAPFHPDQAPAPDLVSDAEHRPVGGLGWMLIRQMMPPLDYRSDDTGNTLVLQRQLRRRPPIRVALFGSFYRGLHVLNALLEGELSHCIRVVGVATDDPSQSYVSPHKRVWQYPHTRQEEWMVQQRAQAEGIEVYTGRVKSPDFYALYEERWKPDLCLMATFGQRIDARLHQYPALGFYNLHPCIEDGWPSRYAGSNPFEAMKRAGCRHAVLAMHHVDDGFDTGKLVAYSRRVDLPDDADVVERHRLTAPAAAELVTRELGRLLNQQGLENSHAVD